MSAPNFDLITELQVCIRRDFPLVAPAILSPLDAAALLEGEWLELNSDYLLLRGAAAVGANAAVFPVHTERGRYETQAIQKSTVIMLGQYEAETTIHPSDLTGYAPGDPLYVGDCDILGYTKRRGLIKAVKATALGTPIVGYVSKVTGSKLRFVHTGVSPWSSLP